MNRPLGIGDFLIELKEAQTTVKGDVPGHEFHGNQYSDGGGSSGGSSGESSSSSGSVSERNRDNANKLRGVFEKNNIPIKEVVMTRSTTIVKLHGRKHADSVAGHLKAGGWQRVSIHDDSPNNFGTDSWRVTAFNPGVNL